MSRLIVILSFAAVAVVGAACGGETAAEPTNTTAPTSSPEGAELPDTSGSAVWDFLQEVDYQTNWGLWPGKGELYEGTEPHGMLLTTYLNDAALEALNSKAGSMPDGAIIVKENYMPDGTYDAATVMYKVDGYDAANNDWFWAKIAADGSIDAEGRVQDCAACHSARADNDYIYTGSMK